jgi:hypothetical protein
MSQNKIIIALLAALLAMVIVAGCCPEEKHMHAYTKYTFTSHPIEQIFVDRYRDNVIIYFTNDNGEMCETKYDYSFDTFYSTNCYVPAAGIKEADEFRFNKSVGIPIYFMGYGHFIKMYRTDLEQGRVLRLTFKYKDTKVISTYTEIQLGKNQGFSGGTNETGGKNSQYYELLEMK